jgi:hypothetical protein
MFHKNLPNSIWSFLVEKHLVKLGTSKINELLKRQDCDYIFPQNFLDDATFALGNVAKAKELSVLKQYLTDDLGVKVHQSIKNLHESNKIFDLNYSHQNLKIRGFDFTIGQYPIPKDFVGQTWLNSITFVIPKEHEKFHSHPRQQELVDAAHKQGCHVKISCTLDCKLDLVVKDKSTGLVLRRDSYSEFYVSFISPHFTPYDDIFTRQPDGSCKLNWIWKICEFENK